MRPITGMGNDLNAEASMFNALPLLLPNGSMEIDALFSLSTGKEPLPIWLRHGTMVTPKAVPNTERSGSSIRFAICRISASCLASNRIAGTRSASRSGSR